jgi:hypothetical protein
LHLLNKNQSRVALLSSARSSPPAHPQVLSLLPPFLENKQEKKKKKKKGKEKEKGRGKGKEREKEKKQAKKKNPIKPELNKTNKQKKPKEKV